MSQLSCWISGSDSMRCPDPMLINENFISVMIRVNDVKGTFSVQQNLLGIYMYCWQIINCHVSFYFLKINNFLPCRFKKRSGIAFKDMLFFDDEHRNIRDLEAHGVISVLVDGGVTMKVIEQGLKMFASRQNKSWLFISVICNTFC